MKQTEIKVLMVEPMKEPKVVTLKKDLDFLQKAVSIAADYQGLIGTGLFCSLRFACNSDCKLGSGKHL